MNLYKAAFVALWAAYMVFIFAAPQPVLLYFHAVVGMVVCYGLWFAGIFYAFITR